MEESGNDDAMSPTAPNGNETVEFNMPMDRTDSFGVRYLTPRYRSTAIL